MQSYMKYCHLVVALSLSFSLFGCGGSNPLNRQAVSGSVTLDGKPLDAGSIEFHPDGPDGTMSGAVITAGKYSVDAARGLPPGSYTVRIFSADEDAEPEEVPGESNKLAVEKIPADFNTDSTQTRTVEAGKENIFDFDIPAKK